VLPADKVGAFVHQQAPELCRIWRLAHTAARGRAFPALLDGVVEAFFTAAGERLAAGGAPGEAWSRLVGGLRRSASLGPVETSREWTMVAEVLRAACEAVNAAPDAAGWLADAVAAAEAGTEAVAHGAPPPAGVLVTVVLAGMERVLPPAERETEV
jgi:hypothetical protein